MKRDVLERFDELKAYVSLHPNATARDFEDDNQVLANFFELVQTHVYRLMSRDSFVRFKRQYVQAVTREKLYLSSDMLTTGVGKSWKAEARGDDKTSAADAASPTADDTTASARSKDCTGNDDEKDGADTAASSPSLSGEKSLRNASAIELTVVDPLRATSIQEWPQAGEKKCAVREHSSTSMSSKGSEHGEKRTVSTSAVSELSSSSTSSQRSTRGTEMVDTVHEHSSTFQGSAHNRKGTSGDVPELSSTSTPPQRGLPSEKGTAGTAPELSSTSVSSHDRGHDTNETVGPVQSHSSGPLSSQENPHDRKGKIDAVREHSPTSTSSQGSEYTKQGSFEGPTEHSAPAAHEI